MGRNSGRIRVKFGQIFGRLFFLFFLACQCVVGNFRSLHVPLCRYWNRKQNILGGRKKKGAREGA